MALTDRLRTVSLTAALTASACGGDSPTAPSAVSDTYMLLDSAPGESIVNGVDQRIGANDGRWTLTSRRFGERDMIDVAVYGQSWWWGLTIASAAGHVLAPGIYNGVGKFPSGLATQPVLSFHGSGSACSQVTGSFTIDRLVVRDGQVHEFRVTFVQYCGNSVPLRGEVSIAGPLPPGY